MEGFSDDDRDVALGHVLGLRWFQLDTREVRVAHTLPLTFDVTSLEPIEPYKVETIQQPCLRGARGLWVPGVNQAQCLRYEHEIKVVRDGDVLYPAEHPVPVRRCLCGFWAYWHLGAQMAAAPHIAGLVKGYGRIVQGPVGFRCQTAEIVALVPLVYDQAAALALEAIYGVDVYGTIEALLEMHKAPDTQPPLADDYFRQARQWNVALQSAHTAVAGRRHNEAVVSYARRAGFLPMRPCITCGKVVCTDEARCQPCQKVMAAVIQEELAKMTAVTGKDALDQLHARREGWAKTTPSILRGPAPQAVIYDEATQVPPEVSVRQKPDTAEATSQIRWALDYMKKKFADGSWWRGLGSPDE